MNAAKILLFIFCLTSVAAAETDTHMPPRGIPVPSEVRAELEAGVKKLGKEIESLQTSPQFKTRPLQFLPDVQIYYNAIRYALDDDIFYKTNDFAIARKFLKEGEARAHAIGQGYAPWNTNTGLVVRGYVSKIDGSVQPYGLVVPVSWKPGDTNAHRLDFWFHGRGDKLSELNFINDREKNPGEFTPPDTFVLHPYGRYCNAYKFAGETDVFEALQNVEQNYPIDTNRISVRGFSMGGAATWHLAVHHAGLWAVASPGAGFVDTPVYQRIFDKKPLPPWYEQKLWHLYDAVDYAANLSNCGLVAYSGEIDAQKAAADLMSNALAAEGLPMTHIIGPNTGHKYEPKAKLEVARLVDAIANKGRDPWPVKINFTTWTLRYNRMDWVTIDGLEKHWERARVNVKGDDEAIHVTTTNVSAFTLFLSGAGQMIIDGQKSRWRSHFGGGEHLSYERRGTNWWSVSKARYDSTEPTGELNKQHGLQGPIDDAFMDSFIFVRPTGKPQNPAVVSWIHDEMTNAIMQWRLQFRGEPRVKNDTDITDADIASNNLILWGDPKNNRLLAKVAPKLPIHWGTNELAFGGKPCPADQFVPVMIYPNPLNPKRYVVLNSGFTFGDFAHLSNALQTPKLPDYAILDISVPHSARVAGGVADAGFFDEHWQLPIAHNK